jgi:hypothetical protein
MLLSAFAWFCLSGHGGGATNWGSLLHGDEDGEVAPPEADCGAEPQAQDSSSTASASAVLGQIIVGAFRHPAGALPISQRSDVVVSVIRLPAAPY